jgi:hypothetical protein
MKILFTTGRIHQIGGGAERSATTLIKKLSEKHRVWIFKTRLDCGKSILEMTEFDGITYLWNVNFLFLRVKRNDYNPEPKR